jgi:hypothetical protein
MGGPDEARFLGVVAERAADFTDQHVEIGFEDERFRPDVREQLRLGDHARTPGHQNAQQVERLGGQADLLAVTQQEPRLRLEDELSEASSHRSPRGLANPLEFLRTAPPPPCHSASGGFERILLAHVVQP